jgi:cytochrome c553
MKPLNLFLFTTLFLLIAIPVAQADGDAAAGEAKAASCGSCHGADGMGIDPNPALAGLDEAYFVEQLAAFKSGARENAMMNMFAGQLSDEDMADLAAYYAGLKSD